MPVELRLSRPSPEAYLALFETTGWNDEYHVSAEELRRANATSQFMVSAYDGERLVGYGRLLSDGVLHAMIYEMIVHPEHQGKGLGSQILQQLIQWCRENHIREAQLFCARGRRGRAAPPASATPSRLAPLPPGMGHSGGHFLRRPSTLRRDSASLRCPCPERLGAGRQARRPRKEEGVSAWPVVP